MWRPNECGTVENEEEMEGGEEKLAIHADCISCRVFKTVNRYEE